MASYHVISLHEIRKSMDHADGDVNNNVEPAENSGDLEPLEAEPGIAREEAEDVREYLRNRRNRLQRHRHQAFRQPTSGMGSFK